MHLLDFDISSVSVNTTKVNKYHRYKNRILINSNGGSPSVVHNERYMDLLGLNNLGSSTTNYGAISGGNYSNFISIICSYWQSATSFTWNSNRVYIFRFIFEGTMIEEKDVNTYKKIPNLR